MRNRDIELHADPMARLQVDGTTGAVIVREHAAPPYTFSHCGGGSFAY